MVLNFGRFARGKTTATTSTATTTPSSGSTSSGTSGTTSTTSGTTKAAITPASITTSTPKTTTTTPTATTTKAATTTPSTTAAAKTTTPTSAATTTPTPATTTPSTSSGSSGGLNFGRTARSGSSSSPQTGDKVTVNGREYTYQKNETPVVQGGRLSDYQAAGTPAIGDAGANTTTVGGTSSNSGSSYYDVDTALNSVYNQAKAAGINVSKPTTYGQSITDSAKAQKIIDDYTASANAIAAKSASTPSTSSSKPVYDISSNVAEVQAAVKDYNLGVAAPKTTQYSSQAEAQSALNSYIDTTQKALDNWSNNQPVQVYDDLGRQQTVTQSQWKQMDDASKNQTWRENYTVLPEEVANANANWWINSNGLYEWTPVTQGDKDHLAQQNAQRKRLGQAEKSTLTAGASPSEAYSKEWYSTGGTRTKAAGNEKLAKLKASSTVNNSASAKTNTAQTNKATVWSAPKTQAVKMETAARQQVAAKDAAAEAAKAKEVAVDANATAVAKQKLVTQKQAELNQTANAKEQAAIKQEIKTLQADATAAKKTAKAAAENASATKDLATATAAVATASSSPFTASKVTKLANEVKVAQKAVEKASAAAAKAGVVDHTGQVLLKDGTWINQAQSIGGRGTGEKSVNVFAGSAKELYATKQEASRAASEAQAVWQKQRDAYQPILGTRGEIIDAIQTGGKLASIGEAGVSVYKGDPWVKTTTSDGATNITYDTSKIQSRSGTAAEYAQAEKDRAKYAKMDYVEITDDMSEKQRQRAETTNAKIYQAKWDTHDRTPKSPWGNQGSLSLVDVNPLTGNSRINVKQGTYSDVQAFKTNHVITDEALEQYKAAHKDSKIALAAASLYGATHDTQALKETWTAGNKRLAETINLPTIPEIHQFRDKMFGSFEIGINDNGRWTISKAGESKADNVISGTSLAEGIGNKIESNPWTSAFAELSRESYQELRTNPLNWGVKQGVIVASGAALGAGIKAVSGVASTGLFAGSTRVANLGTRTALKLETLGTKIGANNMEFTGAKLLAERSAYRAAEASQSIGKYTSKKLYSAAGKTEGAIGVSLGGKLVYDTKKMYGEGDRKGILKLGTELALGSAYFGKGAQFGEKIVDRARTIGSKRISASDVLSKDVLEGRSEFPTTQHGTTVEQVIESFKDPVTGESIGYHASPNPIYPEVRSSAARKYDQQGLYISPLESGASPHFMRVSPYLKPVGTIEAFAGKQGVFGSQGVLRARSVKTSDGKILHGENGKSAFSTAVRNVKLRDVVDTVTGKAQNMIAKATDTKVQKINPNYPSNPQIATPESVANVKSIWGEATTQMKEAILGTQNIQPTVAKIHLPFAVKRMPSKIRLNLRATREAMEKAQPGESYITFKFERNIKRGSAETEATIAPGTKLEKLATEKKYFEYNGRRVAVEEYSARPSSEVDIARNSPLDRMSDEEGAAIWRQALEEARLEAKSRRSPFSASEKRAMAEKYSETRKVSRAKGKAEMKEGVRKREIRESKTSSEYEAYRARPRTGVRMPYTGRKFNSTAGSTYRSSHLGYKTGSSYMSGSEYKSGSESESSYKSGSESRYKSGSNSTPTYGNKIDHNSRSDYSRKQGGGKYEYDPKPGRYAKLDRYEPKRYTPTPYTPRPYTPQPSRGSTYTPAPYTPSPYSGSSGGNGGGYNNGNVFPPQGGSYTPVPPVRTPFPTVKKQEKEDQRAGIKQRARARDKALVAKTKVASFKDMFGQAKKPRASPFKSK